MQATQLQSEVQTPRPFRIDVQLPVALYLGDELHHTVGRNLSPGGMLLVGERRLRVGRIADLALELDGEQFLIQARVARVDERRGAGLQFLHLPRDAKLALVHFVSARREELELKRFREENDLPDTGTHTLPLHRSRATVRLRAVSYRPDPGPAPVPRRRTWAAATGAALLLGAVALGWSAVRVEPIAPPALLPAPGAETPRSEAAAEAALPPPDPLAAQLVGQGDRLYRAGRWTEPRGDSALDRYRAALALEPDSPGAARGIERLVVRSLRQGRARHSEDDFPAARVAYERALAILFDDRTGPAVSEREMRIDAVRALLARVAAR